MYKQDVLTIEEICRKLKPIFGDRIDKIYFNYVSSESKEAKEEIATMIYALYEKHFNNLLDATTLLTPPASKQEVSGEYVIGNVLYGKEEVFPFALREKDLPRHVCITGMSGSGKTTLAFNILEGLIAREKPFLVFDWKKSFRPLLAQDKSLTCFTIGDNKLTNDFKLNINRPPENVSPKEWITVLCDLIAESFFVSYGVHKILLETLDKMFKDWGIYKGSDNYPTWNHIKWELEQRLETAKNREAGWIESALRVATVLTFGDFGEVVNYKGESSVRVSDLATKRVVFELNALGNIEKKFFSEFILTYIYKMRKAQENKIEKGFDYAILVDEAHNIFLKEKTKFVQESVTDMIYREMREYGVSLICLDQHISKLSDTVKGNSACHIAFQQQLPDDIDTVSKLMHLQDHKELFSGLEVGRGVVKLSERYTKPFFVQVPYNDTRSSGVSDHEIQQRVATFLTGNEFVRGNDSAFTQELVHTEKNNAADNAVDIGDLFKNINLPKRLTLHATGHADPDATDFHFAHTEDDTPMSETIYATIQRRLATGEELTEIEKSMYALYEPSEVEKALTQIIAERDREHTQEETTVIDDTEDIEVEKAPISTDLSPDIAHTREKEARDDITEKLNNFYAFNSGSAKRDDAVYDTKTGNQKSYKESSHSSNADQLSTEERKFVTFLENNPDHNLTTVTLYKKVGLSPRKGNKIKNQLVEKGIVKIEEVRDEKGWKKIIKLA